MQYLYLLSGYCTVRRSGSHQMSFPWYRSSTKSAAMETRKVNYLSLPVGVLICLDVMVTSFLLSFSWCFQIVFLKFFFFFLKNTLFLFLCLLCVSVHHICSCFFCVCVLNYIKSSMLWCLSTSAVQCVKDWEFQRHRGESWVGDGGGGGYWTPFFVFLITTLKWVERILAWSADFDVRGSFTQK